MFNDYEQQSSSTASIKHKVKTSMCCFSPSVHDHQQLKSEDKPRTTSPRSPYTWLKSTANELPEIRFRCMNLISRIGKTRRNHHMRWHSADFSYDPSSYALNFQDDTRVDDECPLSFLDRLAASPPQPADFAKCEPRRREIVAFS
ncbi:hypothetical protein CFP56_037897 [Quercus suber]|uniref:Uncharacterized protein n=1 Tax=Quercus suber TaxID=58331 RepID=A0AAW0J3A4_QUESU|nr:hypothetical protein CFP56_29721 [Quercus suber]